jgi:hypothetical protein
MARSFRLLVSLRVYPGLAVLLVLTLAGCGGGGGGGGKSTREQVVRGPGFSLSAPEGWQVQQAPTSVSVAPPGDENTLVAAYSFRTVKPYRSSVWPAASAELDRKAGELARELHGRLVSSETTSVAGNRARQYVLEYGGKRSRITFVLRAPRREYELLCRWKAAANEPDACSRLQSSFKPS